MDFFLCIFIQIFHPIILLCCCKGTFQYHICIRHYKFAFRNSYILTIPANKTITFKLRYVFNSHWLIFYILDSFWYFRSICRCITVFVDYTIFCNRNVFFCPSTFYSYITVTHNSIIRIIPVSKCILCIRISVLIMRIHYSLRHSGINAVWLTIYQTSIAHRKHRIC